MNDCYLPVLITCFALFSFAFRCRAGNGRKAHRHVSIVQLGIWEFLLLLCGDGNGRKAHTHTHTHIGVNSTHKQFMMNDALAHVHTYIHTAHKHIYISQIFPSNIPNKRCLHWSQEVSVQASFVFSLTSRTYRYIYRYARLKRRRCLGCMSILYIHTPLLLLLRINFHSRPINIQPANQSISQPTNQSTNQPINQPSIQRGPRNAFNQDSGSLTQV